MADQVARGAESLPLNPVPGPVPIVGLAHPDAVAAALAVVAAGLPSTFEKKGWWPPACRDALDRAPLVDLGARIDSAANDPAESDQASLDAARQLLDRLEAIGLIGSLGTQRRFQRRAGRPVVTSGAGALEVPDRLLDLVALTLRLDAAWTLEPQADAFASAVTWTRPTIVVATPAELDALAERWGRAERRASRLRAIVVVGSEASPGDAERFAAPVLPWPPAGHPP